MIASDSSVRRSIRRLALASHDEGHSVLLKGVLLRACVPRPPW